MGSGMMYGMMGNAGPWWMWLMMLLQWVVPLAVAVLLFRWIFGRGGCCGHDHAGRSGGDDPLTILKGRYARGEISADEYQRIKSELEKT